MDILIACDLGTSSCKLTALDLSPAAGAARILGTASRPYPTHHAGDGRAEQHPQDWLRAFAAAVRDLAGAGRLTGLCGLAFTGQMSAALLVDGAGEPLHPALIWSDQRAVRETQAAEAAMDGQAFYALTGNRLNATYTGPKLAWLARHEPAIWSRAARFVQPKDWLVACLTGVTAMDHSDASCTGLYDLAAGRWSEALFELFGLPRALAPDLAEAATRIGALRPDMAGVLGLPAGLPVILGGGDGPTTALGTGIAPGEAYASFGTSAWISVLSPAPVIDPARRVFSFRHVVPGLYAVTGSTQNAGSALAWLLDGILQSREPGGDIDAALAATPPGADGLLALPYLQGERTPVWDSLAGGAMVGLRSHHGRAHLVRAFIEAICYQLRLILDTFADCGLTPAELRVVGGLASQPKVMAMLAAILRRRLVRQKAHAHATALGAGMLGAIALGAIEAGEATGWAEAEAAFEPGAEIAAFERGHAAYAALYHAVLPIQAMLRGA